MFARYEVRSQIVGWDHKWVPFAHSPSWPLLTFCFTQLYVVHRFVSHHKLPSPSRRPAPAISNGIYGDSPSLTSTPSDSSADLPVDAARAAAAPHEPEPDGATLHCISVNVTVFKHGRITVPPTLVLAGEGLGATYAQGVAARARAVELGHKGMRKLYRGAWRAVPKGPERWWDVAMHGLEDHIDRRVARVIGVRVGLEGALDVRGL
jgi:hypothetical protein